MADFGKAVCGYVAVYFCLCPFPLLLEAARQKMSQYAICLTFSRCMLLWSLTARKWILYEKLLCFTYYSLVKFLTSFYLMYGYSALECKTVISCLGPTYPVDIQVRQHSVKWTTHLHQMLRLSSVFISGAEIWDTNHLSLGQEIPLTSSTRAHQCSSSWTKWIHSTFLYSVSVRSLVILPSMPGLQSDSPSGFQIIILYVFLSCIYIPHLFFPQWFCYSNI